MFWSQKFAGNIIIFVVDNKNSKHGANKDDLDDEPESEPKQLFTTLKYINFFTTLYKV